MKPTFNSQDNNEPELTYAQLCQKDYKLWIINKIYTILEI
ncbi:hypothetical protein CPAV1605_1275 [seawater metagenome]|uniref:Uncharacterized protein n=1 Tax=seawater metagenome TaxID=1561972 RepID=A0A5E8CL25_9ZZZZ